MQFAVDIKVDADTPLRSVKLFDHLQSAVDWLRPQLAERAAALYSEDWESRLEEDCDMWCAGHPEGSDQTELCDTHRRLQTLVMCELFADNLPCLITDGRPLPGAEMKSLAASQGFFPDSLARVTPGFSLSVFPVTLKPAHVHSH